MKYFAFLSYAHNDAAAAAALGRYIETFRVPVRLGGKEQSLPKRMFPVFRDREEFSASSDLGASIQDALANSGALIVLCSPKAAQSWYVVFAVRHARIREVSP
ncbi:MAG TPA: toll/interleukin-1 receptor domain-containing protein [Candidatus Tyrphobacter sp.]